MSSLSFQNFSFGLRKMYETPVLEGRVILVHDTADSSTVC